MRINNGISRLGLAAAASLAAAGSALAGDTQDVSVSSYPSGASVVIDGQALGNTPGSAALSRDRKHTIVVSKSGFQSQTIEVNPVNGSLVPPDIKVELESSALAAGPAAPTAPAPSPAAAAAPVAAAPVAAAPPEPEPAPVAASPSTSTGLSASEQAESVATEPVTPVPPPGALNQSYVASTLRKNPTAQLLMGGYSVHLGTTTLAEVLQVVGAGHMLQQGHGGKYHAWLCYTIPQGTNGALTPQRVWLTASELNGGVHIDGVDAQRLSAELGATSACPELPGNLASVRFDNGLWLGSTKADLLGKLGAPGAEGDAGWSYSFADEQPNYVVKNLLQTRIDDGRVTALHAGRELKI